MHHNRHAHDFHFIRFHFELSCFGKTIIEEGGLNMKLGVRNTKVKILNKAKPNLHLSEHFVHEKGDLKFG